MTSQDGSLDIPAFDNAVQEEVPQTSINVASTLDPPALRRTTAVVWNGCYIADGRNREPNRL